MAKKSCSVCGNGGDQYTTASAMDNHCSGQRSRHADESQWRKPCCKKVSPMSGSASQNKASPSASSMTVSVSPCHLRLSDKKRLAAINAVQQAAAEQHAFQQHVNLLQLQIDCKRHALRESYKREVEILEENLRLKEALEMDERNAHENVKLLLRKYERLRASMGLLSSKFTADLQRANEQLELARQTLTADITRIEETIQEVDDCVKEKQTEVSILRNYMEKEKPLKDVEIADLERQLRITSTDLQKEVDEIQRLMELEKDKVEKSQQKALNHIRTSCAKEAVSKLPHHVEITAAQNLRLQQEIAAHSDEARRMEESSKSLQLEIKQLSAELRDVTVRQRMFPELYSSPAYSNDMPDVVACPPLRV